MSLSNNIIKKSAFALSLIFVLFSSGYANNCNNRVFNIKVTDNVSTDEILNQLADTCNFSVIRKDLGAKEILKENTSGINIKNLTLREIFNVLLKENNLNYNYDKNVLSISSMVTKTFRIDYITSVREGKAKTKASVDSAPTQVDSDNNSKQSDIEDNYITTTEKFDFWEKIQSELNSIINEGSGQKTKNLPIINKNAGLVTVTATPKQLKRAQDYIDRLNEILKKQVMLDVSIISIQLDNSFKRGVDWSKFQLGFRSYVNQDDGNGKINRYDSGFHFGRPDSMKNNDDYGIKGQVPSMEGITGGFVIGGGIDFNLEGMINFLDTRGKTKVVSNPKVMTLNNQQAIISVGDNINYILSKDGYNDKGERTSSDKEQYSVFIGILLNILPEISDDNKIMLRINPSVSSLRWAEDMKKQHDRSMAPDTMQKKISTVVQVNSGDTIVLGGLISSTKGKAVNEVPVLGTIPILGYLFKSVEDSLKTTELIFVVRPKIVNINDQEPFKKSLKDLGFYGIMYE